jgi:hypothetical protein
MAAAGVGSRSVARRASRRLARSLRSALRPLQIRARALVARPGAPSGVHLSWSEDPSSTLTVAWQTPTRRNPAAVSFRRVGDAAVRRAVGTSRPLPGSPHWLHCAVLRDLAPATTYEYRVSSDAGAAAGAEVWRPVRTPPRARSETYRAAFFCDVGIAGRPDGSTRATGRVLREIAADEPLFYLGGGDYAYARRDPRFSDPGVAIDRWLEQMEPLLARAPFLPQYGNHETELGESIGEWSARFAHPRGSADGRSYSFDVGSAHFVALFAPGVAPAPDHLRWLEEDLASEASRSAVWRIVYQHAPIISSGASHPARDDVRVALMPRFERWGVDLHLSGHDQNYERSHPLSADGSGPSSDRSGGRNRYAAGRGVIYAKVSPAGKLSERGIDFSRFAAAPGPEIAARDDRAHHWARIHVSERELAVDVMALSGEDDAARVVDAFALTRAE